MSDFICKECKGTKFIICDSRKHNGYVRRRRKCVNCDTSFTTYEISREDFEDLKKKLNELNHLKESLEILKNL